MAKLKHIYTSAETGGEKKTVLNTTVVSIEDDGSMSFDNTSFLLPEEESRLIGFVKDTFAVGNSPTNVSREDFGKYIVEYTLDAATKPINYNDVNKYYDAKLNNQAAQDAVATGVGDSFKPIEDLFLDLEQKQKDNLSSYEDTLDIGEDIVTFSGAPAKDIEFLQPQDGDFTGELGFEEDEFYSKEEDMLDLSKEAVQQANNLNEFKTPEQIYDESQKELFGDKPTEGGQRPVVDLAGMSESKTKVFANLSQASTMMFKGIAGARLIEPVKDPIHYPGDAIVKGENNSGIICGRDELYRLKGHTRSGAVYIYAGRNPNTPPEQSPDGVGPPQILTTPNDLISDSAYIYISQKADVDSLYKYKVSGGTYSKVISPLMRKGEKESRLGISLAAIKADDVLIMSRVSGIRLITGTDKKNSKGSNQNSKFGIDLIAGNDDSDLQPLVKGNNLVRYLSSLSKSIDELRSVVYDFINSQSKFNATVSKHTHWDQFGIFLGTAGPKNPLAINGGKGLPSTELASAGTTALLETIRQQSNTVKSIMNKIGNDANAMNRIGSYNILSDKNRTN